MDKVLIVGPTSNLTGSSKSLLEILKINTSHDISVLLPGDGPLVSQIPSRTKIHFANYFPLKRGLINILKYPLGQLLGAIKLFQLLIKYDIKVVHINSVTVIFPALITKIFRRKVVYHVRETKGFYLSFIWFLYELNVRIFADEIIGCCKTVVSSGFQRKKLIRNVAYNWYSQGYEFKPPLVDLTKEKISITTFAAEGNRKGLDIFLKSISRLNLESKFFENKFEIDIYSQEPSSKWFTDKLSASKKEFLERNNNIKFHGIVEFIDAIYLKTDIFVTPSLQEAFPRSVLEAMSYAKYVIATDAGGTEELISDRAYGVIVPSGNLEELYEAIKTVSSNLNQPFLNLEAKGRVDELCDPQVNMKIISEIYSRG